MLAVQKDASGLTNHRMIATMNVFQVGLGLLLLSVDAATSLIEERVRGSLDILLSTPLSTPSILAGKWLGAFRRVPQLLFLHGAHDSFPRMGKRAYLAYLNLVALLLAYRRFIVSLGLALATWQSRLDRAIALCVAFYVLLSIGWPALLIPMANAGRMTEHVLLPLMMGTPLLGTLFGTLVVAPPDTVPLPGTPAGVWVGCYLWIAIDGALAAFLYSGTLASFDRCLGRMRESGDVQELHYLPQLGPRHAGRDFLNEWHAPFVAAEPPSN